MRVFFVCVCVFLIVYTIHIRPNHAKIFIICGNSHLTIDSELGAYVVDSGKVRIASQTFLYNVYSPQVISVDSINFLYADAIEHTCYLYTQFVYMAVNKREQQSQ